MKGKLSKNRKTDTSFKVLKEKKVETNDFDLEKGKIPTQSTIKAQIKSAEELLKNGVAVTQRIEFDRLKIAVFLPKYGKEINFKDLWLEEVAEPWKRPSYSDKNKDSSSSEEEIDESFEDSNKDFDITAYFETGEGKRELEEYSRRIESEYAKRPNLFKDTRTKKRISYKHYKECIGLNNLYIYNGFLIIDITGKWMADNGFLGTINRDNIEEAIQRILELGVINFNLDLFLKHAQIFLCDVCIDLLFEVGVQCERAVLGISSFFPLATNRFSIKKYGRHGLFLLPKAQNKGFSLAIYYKGEELSNSTKRWTIVEKYTFIIGKEGQDIADRTLRLEAKLQNLATIRDVLGLEATEKGVVPLMYVLNSTAPVMLKQFELFCGTPEVLLERLEWLQEVREDDNNFSFNEILVAERITELFRENNYDITLVRNHIRTEYPNVKDSEIEKVIQLANLRKNVLNFLVYHKPKTITVMLDILSRLYLYYSADSTTGGTND